MKLRRITVRRMPGIDDKFTVDGLTDGLNLIVGPNGSGKSTLCRTLRAALWPASERGHNVAIEAEWRDGTDIWLVRRERERTAWQHDGKEVEAPELPDAGSAGCFTLGFRDLLHDGSPTDEEIALTIRRQMSGGFDVQNVIEREFTQRARQGLVREARLRERQRELDKIRNEQRSLAVEEDRLHALKRRLSEAEAAASRLDLLRRAAELQRVRGELAVVEAELARFPESMHRLQGGEKQRLDELADESNRLRERLDRCRREGESAGAEMQSERLPGGPIDDPTLHRWSMKARTLQQYEVEIDAAGREVAAALARRDEAARGLDPESRARREPQVAREAVLALEIFLQRAGALQREREALQAERGLLAQQRSLAESRVLDQGIERLRAWLAAREAGASSSRRPWVLAIGIVLLAVGALVGLLVDRSAGWALGASGLTVLTLSFFQWLTSRDRRDAEAVRHAFEELGLDPPDSWRPKSARERLRSLEREYAESVVQERQRARSAVLDSKQETLGLRQSELDAERRGLCERLGIDPGRGDLDLLQTARNLGSYQTARAEHQAALAAFQKLEQDKNQLLAEIRSFLDSHDAPAAPDGAGAWAAIEDLKARTHRVRGAAERLRRARAEHAGFEEALERVQERRKAVFDGAGLEPGNEAELLSRLARRERFLELNRLADQHRLRVEEDRRKLIDYPAMLALSAEEIDRQIAETRELADSRTELAEQRGAIRGAVDRARSGEELERAMAHVAEARTDLHECRDDALSKTAGRFLLESVGAEFDQHSRPAILSRAVDLFARFTHHRYELHVDARAETPTFRALETETGRGKALAELSDATRVQLLLAARLAFAAHADRRGLVPLFLDEVLTTSDPERFLAVARSLIVLIREEGRQILYLTANPSDVTQWNRVLRRAGLEAVEPIDLARLRGMTIAARTETELEVPPLPEIPAPAGVEAEQYGALLNVPRVDLRKPATALHLFHLLRDELDLLYVLLNERIQTVGQWRDFAGSGAGPRLVGPERAERITALCDLAAAFFESWRIGRGRRIEADTLRDAEISETWVERLESLIGEVAGDAGRLLAELERREDERTKGFQTRIREKLREFLIANGHLDERESLDEQGIQARVRIAVAHHVESERLAAEEIAARVHALFHQAGVGVSF